MQIVKKSYAKVKETYSRLSMSYVWQLLVALIRYTPGEYLCGVMFCSYLTRPFSGVD